MKNATREVLDDVVTASASALAAAVRVGEISSVELVDACLQRIEAVNPRLNAVVQLTPERARLEAQAADAARARQVELGPLHGVPVTIKDAFDVRGVVSTGGTAGRANHVPETDATVVARLRAAGAIVLGKTNLPELSLSFESDNDIYGRTSNPYDLSRTSGGSTGGEAAIIAAGGSPLGVGTDAAGSIRVPAHFCGIAGLKPTRGRVPMTGAFPLPSGHTAGLWHAGPLARHVEDLALALSIMSGPDGRDAACAPVPLASFRDVDVSAMRVAVHAHNGIAAPTPETIATVATSARVLADAGAMVREARPDGIQQTFELIASLFGADGGAGVQALLGEAGTRSPSALLMGMAGIVHPFATSAAGLSDVLGRWDLFRTRMLTFLDGYDAILTPACAFPAPPHGTTLDPDHLPGFSYTMAYDLTGWPAVVVRAGTSPEGLPIGVQIVARPWREDVALALALQVEAALGGWQAPPL